MIRKAYVITGCSDCDKSGELSTGLCDKHKLEYKKYCAETAQETYMEELRVQSQKQESRKEPK